MKRTLILTGVAIGAIALILLSVLLGGAVRAATATGLVAAPAGLTKYLVFMAGDAAVVPGDTFQRDVMKRSPAQIAAFKAKAEQNFYDLLGLDFSHAPVVSGTQTVDGATLVYLMIDMKHGYRAYTVSGENVPPEGWPVYDAFWMVTYSKQQVVHGTYGGAAGKTVMPGEFVVYGEYAIMPPGRAPILIQFRDPMPMMGDPSMGIVFDCEIQNAAWGAGRAIGGVGMAMTGDDGKPMMTPIREVLTFGDEMMMMH